MSTIFHKILSKQIPAREVYEDEDIFAFHDINPQAPVHVLVIPKDFIKNYSELESVPADVVAKLFAGAAKVARILGLNENGYRVVINCGRNGQQTVDYIHLHILGGRLLSWPPG